MEQTVSLENQFRNAAFKFGVLQGAERRVEEESKARQSLELARSITDRQAKLSWLIKQAQENLSSMLNSGDKEFEEYVQSLFKRVCSFKDRLGLCGFKVLEPKWQKAGVKRTKQIFGSKVLGQTSGLVGTLDDCNVDVRIIELYTEKTAEESPREIPFSMEQPIGGHGRSHTCQILALTSIAPNGYTEPASEQIRKAKLVHLEQTTRGGTFQFDYAKAEPVSLDQGFIDALLELVIPETTLRLLFKKFGLPKSK